MGDLPDFRAHTRCTDPGPYAALLRDLPADVEGMARAARNVIVHYRAQLPELTADRLPEINSRWLSRILERDQARFGGPLLEPRPLEQRVAGCCRDHSLFLTAALREHGTPARNRVGFATYLSPGWAIDHVITEHHDGQRWVRDDPEFATGDVDFDPRDLGGGLAAPHHSAAEAWLAWRAGELDLARHAVFPDAPPPLSGPDLVRRYVVLEVAHRYGDELLLWDTWGGVGLDRFEVSDEELDELARLLVAADAEDGTDGDTAERELYARYRADDRLHPGPTVLQHSVLDQSATEVRLDQPKEHP